MIKESTVEVNGHRTNIDHFQKLGYNIQFKKPCLINVEDLLPGSTIKITSICDNCGVEKAVNFRDYYESTNSLTEQYFCKKCNSIKRKKTCLDRFGTENPMQSDSVKQKLKSTFIEKYGVDHYSKTEEYKAQYKQTCLLNWEVDNASKSQKVKDKIVETTIANLGVSYPQQSEIVMAKSKQTSKSRWGKDRFSQTQDFKFKVREKSQEKWGVDNYSQTDEFKTRTRETSLQKWGVEHYAKTETFKKSIRKIRENLTKLKYDNLIGSEFSIKNYDISYFEIEHSACSKVFKINRDNLYGRINLGVCICTECYPINFGMSNMELEMQDFLNSLNISYTIKDKKVLDGKELDILIPESNIAIEMNGLYWHSEIYMDKNYHLNKTIKCKEKGIDLLHIWEDDWKTKRPIIKSIILNKLGLITQKVFARKTQIKEVSPSDAQIFLNENHIQGASPSQIRLGLFYEDYLVSLMTFGYRYTNSKKEFELIRFCNKINCNVIGGASKLFNHLLFSSEVDEVISYSDRSIFNGRLYQTLGFNHQRTSQPNYFWVVDGVRRHRFNYNKKRLIKLGHDQNKTEVEILHDLGYFRVFSCGQEKWVYHPNVNLIT